MLDAEPLLQAARSRLDEEQQHALHWHSNAEAVQAPGGVSLGSDLEAFTPAHAHRQLADRLVRQLGELPGAAGVLPEGWQEALRAGVLPRRRLKLYKVHLKDQDNYSSCWRLMSSLLGQLAIPWHTCSCLRQLAL
jgi:hypothetical protein